MSEAPEKRRRRSRTEWIKIEEKWASGDYTLAQLMDQHSIARNTLTSHFKKHGIKKGSKAERHRRAVERQMETRQVKAAEETAEMIAKIKSTNLQQTEVLQKAAFATVMRAMRDNKPLESVHGAVKTIHEALKAIKCGYDVQASILHLDREQLGDDELPELIIHELTAEDIEAMREQQRLENDEIEGALAGPDIESEATYDDDDDIVEEG